MIIKVEPWTYLRVWREGTKQGVKRLRDGFKHSGVQFPDEFLHEIVCAVRAGPSPWDQGMRAPRPDFMAQAGIEVEV